jgi:hypothetical protein
MESKTAVVALREHPARRAVIAYAKKVVANWIVYLMRVYDRLDKQL